MFLTHAHLDHIAGLPMLVDSIFDENFEEPLTVYACCETLDAIKAHRINKESGCCHAEPSSAYGLVEPLVDCKDETSGPVRGGSPTGYMGPATRILAGAEIITIDFTDQHEPGRSDHMSDV